MLHMLCLKNTSNLSHKQTSVGKTRNREEGNLRSSQVKMINAEMGLSKRESFIGGFVSDHRQSPIFF